MSRLQPQAAARRAGASVAADAAVARRGLLCRLIFGGLALSFFGLFLGGFRLSALPTAQTAGTDVGDVGRTVGGAELPGGILVSGRRVAPGSSYVGRAQHPAIGDDAQPVSVAVQQGGIGTWTIWGKNAKVVVTRLGDGNTMFFESVDGRTQLQGIEVKLGVIEGTVTYEGEGGGKFVLSPGSDIVSKTGANGGADKGLEEPAHRSPSPARALPDAHARSTHSGVSGRGNVHFKSGGAAQPDMRRSSKRPAYGCLDCCNDGERTVACLDVEACAAEAVGNGRYAFVLTHIGRPQIEEGRFLPFLGAMKAQADDMGADIFLIMTTADVKRFVTSQKRVDLAGRGLKLVEVEWAVPPDMQFQRKENWCGFQDLIRLHALSLDGYDAVAYYDSDVEFQGDVLPVLQCASTGRFLSTSGGVGEPLNVGFFSLRPDPRYMEAARIFARNAPFNDKTGWANSGFRPSGGYFVGAECGQGFFHTLFYKRSSAAAQNALEQAGFGTSIQLRASQIDRCVWNYQTSFRCHPRFDCATVRAHHKPTGARGSDPNECEKLARRLGTTTTTGAPANPAPPASMAAPPLPMSVASTLPCSYTPGSPQSSRPGVPCIPPADYWPYRSREAWRVVLGERILAAVTPTVEEHTCDGFELFGDQTWCRKTMGGSAGLLGLSYGIEQRDMWSEKMGNLYNVPARLYDCFIPPDQSPPISGTAPNGTGPGGCKTYPESSPCYEVPYNSYRVCLGPIAEVHRGRRYDVLEAHLRGRPPLSVHLKIDTEGTEWSVLERLLEPANKPLLDTIRTLDMEVHFGFEPDQELSWVRHLQPQPRLEREVRVMEGLLGQLRCTGSTLEVYREGWRPRDNCPAGPSGDGTCSAPPVYLSGGFSMQQFAVSYVNSALL